MYTESPKLDKISITTGRYLITTEMLRLMMFAELEPSIFVLKLSLAALWLSEKAGSVFIQHFLLADYYDRIKDLFCIELVAP